MNKKLTHLLLAFLLLCAQALAGVHATEHAIEHAVGDEQGLPGHACELCLAAHDLGNALSSSIAAPAVLAAVFIPHTFLCSARAALPAPQARQQSPPYA